MWSDTKKTGLFVEKQKYVSEWTIIRRLPEPEYKTKKYTVKNIDNNASTVLLETKGFKGNPKKVTKNLNVGEKKHEEAIFILTLYYEFSETVQDVMFLSKNEVRGDEYKFFILILVKDM